MKKLVMFAIAAVTAIPLISFAAEAVYEQPKESADPLEEEEEFINPDDLPDPEAAPKKDAAWWPAFISWCEWPSGHPDVIGLRLTFPFSSKQESVTGFDVGLWGRSRYFEGFQFNVFRNDVKDSATGMQFGVYNSVGNDQLLGLQAGLWNETGAFTGLQAGLINVCGSGEGFQVGIINRAETFHGFQVGVINIQRDAEIKFFPGLNVGF